MYYCKLTNENALSNVVTKFDCLNNGGEWVNNPKNFDNSYSGFMTLFEISTASWVQTMWDAVDSRGIEVQPKIYSNLGYTTLIISLVVIFTFFLINLFVGVLVTTFNQEKEILGKNFLLTPH